MKRASLVLAVAALTSVGLVWACVFVYGTLAVLATEHRLFGFPAYLAMSIQDVVAWVPLSVLAGVALRFVLRRDALTASILTAVVSIAFLLFGGNLDWASYSFSESAETAAAFFLLPVISLCIFIPLGAQVAKRWINDHERA